MSASRPARVKTNVQDRLVRGQLDKILSSNVFARTERLRNFFRFIVEESLQGRADSLKEQVLACEIYGRGADFEAAIDPVVRVDARRLRDKLREYYSEFPNDPLIISLPKGGYAPAFERNPDSIGVVQEIHREKPAPSSAPGSADQQPKPTQVRGIALAVAAVGEAGTSGAAPGPSLTQVQRSQRWQRIAVGSSALVAVAIAISFAMWLRFPETAPPPRPVRFAFTPGTNVADLVISPNGRHIAYLAEDEETKLWVQDLDQQEPRELVAASPAGFSLFWSPDSDFIGFIAGGELKKIPARGGGQLRCFADCLAQPSWAERGAPTATQLFSRPANR